MGRVGEPADLVPGAVVGGKELLVVVPPSNRKEQGDQNMLLIVELSHKQKAPQQALGRRFGLRYGI